MPSTRRMPLCVNSNTVGDRGSREHGESPPPHRIREPDRPAATFSTRWSGLPVPGMAGTCGSWCRGQSRRIWAGAAPRMTAENLGVHLAAGAAQFTDGRAHVLGVPADPRVRHHGQAPRLLVLFRRELPGPRQAPGAAAFRGRPRFIRPHPRRGPHAWLRSPLTTAFVQHPGQLGQQTEVDGIGNVHEKVTSMWDGQVEVSQLVRSRDSRMPPGQAGQADAGDASVLDQATDGDGRDVAGRRKGLRQGEADVDQR